MSSYSNTNEPPKKENRSKWMIGCGIGAIIILCVVIFLVVGGLVGLQKFFGSETADLNVEVLPQPSNPMEGDDFKISVILSNVGTRNITITEIHLPDVLAGLAIVKDVVPQNMLVQKEDNPNQYVLNLLIAPNGQQTIDFFFVATQAGDISNNVTVFVGKKSTTSAVEIDILPKLFSIDDPDDQLPVSPVEEFGLEGQVILLDEFNDDTNHWEVGEFEGAIIDITGGQMVMEVIIDNMWAYSIMLDTIYENVNLAVDVEVIAPAQDANFGLICGFQDEGNFAALEIKPDGYYSIWVFDQNRYKVLVDWTYSELISTSGPYAIGAYCGLDRLALSVDDVVLVETVPPNFRIGKVGVIAGTYSDYPLTIGFDNFTVLGP
jgi:hypothetical protein